LIYFPLFNSGSGSEPLQHLASLTDPHLISLRDSIPELIIQDVAPSTRVKYQYSLRAWSEWTKEHKIQEFPASGDMVALYLMELARSPFGMGPLESFVAALNWAHKKQCLPLPSAHPLVSQILASCRRTKARPVSRKTPISPDHIDTIFSKFYFSNTPLNDLQTLTMISIGFAGFLRFSDLSQLRHEHISFFPDSCSLFLGKRKNDQYRAGNTVWLHLSGKPTCPVSILHRFMLLSSSSYGLPLFRKISHGHSITFRQFPISYSSARENFLEIFSRAGLSHLDIGLHSLRSGGASQAAAAGVDDESIRQHGSWRSLTAHLNYIQKSKQALLLVPKSLNV
jgi:integrase